ncbi:MAG TPA: hypothetical protein VL614_14205 [Acetobacteraceae bacterium]|nr:hypothetical protein [Acetobacteraceae bacterium]
MSIGRARESGLAVLIVLCALALIALLVTRVMASGRAELSLAANLSSAEIAQAIADGAVYEAIFRIMARQWAADGGVRRLRIGAADAELQIVDLAGRINPNEVSRPVMLRLLVAADATPAQADAVTVAMADWRTRGDEAEPLGANAPHYLAAHRSYVPTDQPFRNVQEIGLVLGMTPKLLAALTLHLSLFALRTPDPLRAVPLAVAARTAEVGGLAPSASPS